MDFSTGEEKNTFTVQLYHLYSSSDRITLFGFNILSALAVGALFGILHLGSGRKYSFAVWATFVGFVYGYATIASSSVIVPMAAHGLNNLVGGLLWRFSKTSPSK